MSKSGGMRLKNKRAGKASPLFWLLFAALLAGWWFRVKAPAMEYRARLDAAASLEKVNLASLRRKNAGLARRRRLLRNNDPYLLEALAREKLHWGKADEIFSASPVTRGGKATARCESYRQRIPSP